MTIELIFFLPNPKIVSFVWPLLGIPMVTALTPDDIDIIITEIRSENELRTKNVGLVGISALTCHANTAYNVADIYREKGI